MKKVLLASSALALTAGMASATVEVTGGGVVGFIYDGASSSTMLHYELDFNVVASTETDGGIGFSASFDLDLDDGSPAFYPGTGGTASRINDPEIKISFTNGSISFGTISSAVDSEVPGLPDPGFDGIGIDNDVEGPFFDVGMYNVLANYTFAMGSISVSGYVDDGTTTGIDDFAIAGSFDLNGITVGVGYEDVGGSDFLSLGVAGDFNGIGYNLFVSQGEVGGSTETLFGVAGSYQIDEMTKLIAVYGAENTTALGAGDEADFGVGIERSLGGGVAFAAGVGSVDGETMADAGFTFSF